MEGSLTSVETKAAQKTLDYGVKGGLFFSVLVIGISFSLRLFFFICFHVRNIQL